MRQYAVLRSGGMSPQETAAEMGIHLKTARRYDRESYLAELFTPASEVAA
jgi:hypothetical protein